MINLGMGVPKITKKWGWGSPFCGGPHFYLTPEYSSLHQSDKNAHHFVQCIHCFEVVVHKANFMRTNLNFIMLTEQNIEQFHNLAISTLPEYFSF